ncbi:hypothetical protein [Lysobacter sp. Root983]|uniref:hypothetical protein n=1 Tax=Lysobacter sp. Root983 TaxID=1736613 RepID=UPI0007095DF0|nr:hypothetical protein [Lysobacter sp. Root983]KRD73553.1 hypothetical protein ASE43_18260 [Lysobacter sp. Root983]
MEVPEVRGIRMLWLCLLLAPASAFAFEGEVAGSEISLGGIAVGATTSEVTKTLGKPLRQQPQTDFIDLDYHYPNLQVSFSDGVVAGLYSDHRKGCTPMRLCPGDRLDKMRSLYGAPIVANRETGQFYEYYATDFDCWLEIAAEGEKIKSIAVACQP